MGVCVCVRVRFTACPYDHKRHLVILHKSVTNWCTSAQQKVSAATCNLRTMHRLRVETVSSRFVFFCVFYLIAPLPSSVCSQARYDAIFDRWPIDRWTGRTRRRSTKSYVRRRIRKNRLQINRESRFAAETGQWQHGIDKPRGQHQQRASASSASCVLLMVA